MWFISNLRRKIDINIKPEKKHYSDKVTAKGTYLSCIRWNMCGHDSQTFLGTRLRSTDQMPEHALTLLELVGTKVYPS